MAAVKTAKLASKCDDRTVADTLAEWTEVNSKRGRPEYRNKAGLVKSREDGDMVNKLEESAERPQGNLFSEADGVNPEHETKERHGSPAHRDG